MRLVLREYLSMMRESGELDVLLPDLLLAMGIDPLSRPSIGSRQFGVDAPAVGLDPHDAHSGSKLFLFTVKRGDITRADWNTGPQAVRPSLDEILDSYLRTRVRPEHEQLPKKIILVTGGELRQDVEPDWINYKHANRDRYPQYGPIEFDFWGGDKLSLLFEEFLFDEFLFPESSQKQIRKTIALADQNEEEPRHFYALVHDMLFERGLPTQLTAAARKSRRKALVLLDLSLHIVFRWCDEVGNLKPAILCSERAMLTAWDWMRRSQLFACRESVEGFARLSRTHRQIAHAFFEKARPYTVVRDGLFSPGADSVEYSLRTFELIGHLGVLTAAHIYGAAAADGGNGQSEFENASAVAAALTDLIKNNPSAHTPRFDGHAIDIVIGLLALTVAGPDQAAEEWLERLSRSVVLAMKAGRDYPIATDSYEDLIAMEAAEPSERKGLRDVSTLLPILAEWMAVLDLADLYAFMQAEITQNLGETDLQMWFPDAATEDLLYAGNAGYGSGATLSSIQLAPNVEGLRSSVMRVSNVQEDVSNNISCLREGWPIVALIASRHFRTPVIPALWQQAIEGRFGPNDSVSDASGRR